jgi:hypothetical protein
MLHLKWHHSIGYSAHFGDDRNLLFYKDILKSARVELKSHAQNLQEYKVASYYHWIIFLQHIARMWEMTLLYRQRYLKPRLE